MRSFPARTYDGRNRDPRRSPPHTRPVFGAVALTCVAITCGALLPGTARAAVVRDPNPQATKRIVALGDSFISGEGAKRFFAETNRKGSECRRSSSAHPWLVAKRLGFGLTFVACSGATTEGLLTKGDQNEPAQLTALAAVPNPAVVIVSIGGNDAGFGGIVQTCLTNDCTRQSNTYLDKLLAVENNLVVAYSKTRAAAPNATIFALTYPNPLGADKSCLPTVSNTEWLWLRDTFIPALNASIRRAAEQAGVNVIDIRDAFNDNRLCEKGKPTAFNTLKWGRVANAPLRDLKKHFHNSFHPNEIGHQFIARTVQANIELRTGNPEPQQSIAFAPPPEPSPPPPEYEFPTGMQCSGEQILYLVNESAPVNQRSVLLSGTPGSQFCFRSDGGSWQTGVISDNGTFTLPLPRGASKIEVLFQDGTPEWTKLTITKQ
jgi:lysophospholipase L1-like esterase